MTSEVNRRLTSGDVIASDDKGGEDTPVRIPVSSPYIEVRMDTSGPYALIKTRTDTSGIYTPT